MFQLCGSYVLVERQAPNAPDREGRRCLDGLGVGRPFHLNLCILYESCGLSGRNRVVVHGPSHTFNTAALASPARGTTTTEAPPWTQQSGPSGGCGDGGRVRIVPYFKFVVLVWVLAVKMWHQKIK